MSAHLCWYSCGYPCLYYSVFMRPIVGESEKGEELQQVARAACAQPVSLIGQMSCVHYKRGERTRWEAISPGISLLGSRAPGPRAGFLVGLLEGWNPCVMWILFGRQRGWCLCAAVMWVGTQQPAMCTLLALENHNIGGNTHTKNTLFPNLGASESNWERAGNKRWRCH